MALFMLISILTSDHSLCWSYKESLARKKILGLCSWLTKRQFIFLLRQRSAPEKNVKLVWVICSLLAVRCLNEASSAQRKLYWYNNVTLFYCAQWQIGSTCVLFWRSDLCLPYFSTLWDPYKICSLLMGSSFTAINSSKSSTHIRTHTSIKRIP